MKVSECLERADRISRLRQKLSIAQVSIGSWMQIPHSSIAEIMGKAGYDWVTVDLEHGTIAVHQLPDLFRALELGGTLPLVRLAEGKPKDCKQALDAGAAGVIVPMVTSATQLEAVRAHCCWPPAGERGVGFSRANLYGKYFDAYQKEAQSPLLIAMIEHISALEELPKILEVKGLDAIFIGPYDLSASMGITADFEHPQFSAAMKYIQDMGKDMCIPYGMHVVEPSLSQLQRRIQEGCRFLAYSIDAVMLRLAAECIKDNLEK